MKKNALKLNTYILSLIASLCVLVFVSGCLPFLTFAQEPPAGTGSHTGGTVGGTKVTVQQSIPSLTNPLKVNSVEEALLLIVDIAVYIGIIFAVIMIIYSGFKFIAARGNPQGLKDARDLFFAVIIGLAILIAAKGIVEIVKTTLINAKVVNENAFKKP